MAETVHAVSYEGHSVEKRRVGWGAIIAGVILVIVFQLTLSILGTAIGLTVYTPGDNSNEMSAKSSAVAALVWWLVTWLISLFFGSLIAAKICGCYHKGGGSLIGLVTWALSVILTIFLLSSAVGKIVGGAFSLIGSSVSAVGSAVSKVAPELAQKAEQMLPNLGNSQIAKDVNEAMKDPNQRQQLTDALKSVLSKGKQASEEDREKVVNILMKSGNMTHDEAEQKLDSWIQSYEQAKEKLGQAAEEAKGKAKEVATTATNIGAKAAWWAFIMLVLGAIVSLIGGAAGACCPYCKEETKTVTTKNP